MRVGALALVVRDYDEAIAWYTDKLGFSLIEDTVLNAHKRWVVIRASDGGADLILAKASKPEDQTGDRVFLFLYTEKFDETYADMKVKGVIFTQTPRQEAYGKVVVFRDLYGNKWDLVERR